MPTHLQTGPPSADPTECKGEPLAEDDSLIVRDVMRRGPKTLPRNATVGDLRRLFDNPKVLDVVLVDGTAFSGVVDRDAVDGVPNETLALDLARSSGVTIAPEASVKDAMARMDKAGGWRLVVVGSDGATLEGLLCLNATRTGFCR